MPTSDKTTRFNWLETVTADKTEVKAQHINELREAADTNDYRLDYHVMEGGDDRHPNATPDLSGFESPHDKRVVDEMNTHTNLVDHRLTNVDDAIDPKDAINLKTLQRLQDSFAIRSARYHIAASSGAATFNIDMTRWQTEWDTMWSTRYADKPNPGFQVVVIPAITHIETGPSLSDYPKLLTEIQRITRLNDVKLQVVVNVTGMSGGEIHTYSCRSTGIFTFTVLGASKNMFRDDGDLN